MSIEKAIKELTENCPLLQNENFLTQFPSIKSIATFFDSVAKASYNLSGRYKIFDDLGINNIQDYLSLLQNGDKRAISVYTQTKDSLRL